MFRTMAGYCACRRVSPLRSWPAHEPAMDRGVLHGFGVAGSTTPLLVLPPLANVALIESRQVHFATRGLATGPATVGPDWGRHGTEHSSDLPRLFD